VSTSPTDTAHGTSDAWLTALHRAMSRVGAARSSPEIVRALAEGLVEDFGIVMAAVWVYDPSADSLALSATAGLPGYVERAPPTLPPRDLSLTIARVVATGEPEIIEEIGEDSGFKDPAWLIGAGLRAYAGLPLTNGDQACGAVSIFFRRPWPNGLLDAVLALGRQAALAIELARLIEESHTLQAIAAEAAATRDPDELLASLVNRTRAAVGAEGCAVWFLDEDSGVLVNGASVGLSDAFVTRLRHPSMRGSTANFVEVRRTGRPLYTRDDPASAGTRDRRLAEALAQEGIVSALRLPLFEPGGRVTGMLALYHRRERVYSENEIRQAQAFTDQIAVALHNARLAAKEREAQAAVERQLRRLTMLTEATEQLLASADMQSVLRIAAESAARLTDAQASVVALVKPGRRKLVIGATHGHLNAWFRSFTESTLDDAYQEATATGDAIAGGEVTLIPDYAARPVLRPIQAETVAAGVRSLIAAPLRKGGTLLGMLWVAGAEPYTLNREDALLVHSLADQVALAMEQSRLIEESHTLQVIAADLASTRDTRLMLDGIAQRSMAALAADGCAVWLIDGSEQRLVLGAATGLSGTFLERVQQLLAVDERAARAASTSVTSMTGPMYSADDQSRARGAGESMADALRQEGIISALRLPLFEPDGDVVGMLALYHRHQRTYSPGEVRLAQAFTDQVAVALHNTRLADMEREAQAAAQRQLERLKAITRITEQLLGARELSGVLRIVVEAAAHLSGAGGAMVGLIDNDGRRITAVAAEGEPRQYFDQFTPPAIDAAFLRCTPTGQAIARRAPVVVEDYAAWPHAHPAHDETVRLGVRAFVVAPLLIGGRPTGVLWVNDTRPRTFQPEDVALVQALADQAALAIDHARLVQRGQDAAVIEERTRLARDLHDSVTQSVFSLGMMARAAQTQHARGSDQLGATLGRIADLSQDALREMRALLFELQPTGLADDGLGPALRKLADAVRLRLDLRVTFKGDTSMRLAPETETAIFRIVQEALANAAKHAKATRIVITIDQSDSHLRFTVRDNGTGFDPNAPVIESADGRQGGMGMRTMRERAAATGLNLRIRSRPGRGTSVIVDAPIAVEVPASA
jgi:GAF domain-containing protein/two-component sensor histidine kinase